MTKEKGNVEQLIKKVYNPSKESQLKVKTKRKKAFWDFLGIKSI